ATEPIVATGLSACRCADHRSVRLQVAAIERWDVRPARLVPKSASRCWTACRCTVAASRRASPPTSPAAVDRQIEQVIVVIHHLDTSRSGPVSLEDLGSLSEVAHYMHPAYSASNQQGLERA